MMLPSLHPCDLGDIPAFVQFSAHGYLIPLDEKNLQSNWKTRYPSFLERRKQGGLWVNVKECDQWLDERGKKLFSRGLIEEKRRRNPGWIPAGDRLSLSNVALAGSQTDFIAQLATLVASKLNENSTLFSTRSEE